MSCGTVLGRQSLIFNEPVYVRETASVVGKKEGDGPLGKMFDKIIEDPFLGKGSWEEAESELQKEAVDKLISKANVTSEDVRYIFGGDLLGQLIATSFAVEKYNIPMFGLYGACSTFGEALSLSAMSIAAGYADNVVAIASSHFASAEKQFRYPLEYGNQRPMASTWTVTGCGAALVGKDKSDGDIAVKIKGVTTGKIVDYGVKDSMNMGACMAPAAADLIVNNFKDLDVDEHFYDLIVTGDLGYVGRKILNDLLVEKGINISDRYTDCGIEIFDKANQSTNAGGSGCGCSAVTMCSYICNNISSGKYGRVLFIPTGALLSTVSYNEGNSVPGIAHGVILERAV